MPWRRALAFLFALWVPFAAHGSRAEKRVQPVRSKARAKTRARPTIELTHFTTHETFNLRPDPAGRFGAKQLRGFRHFLRCHHTGREHAMNPRIAQLLYATACHFGDRPITVVAGYRAPKVARKKGNPRSPHKSGIACDFRVKGVANPTLRDYLRSNFKGVGVGFYPNSGFIHLDVERKKNAFWIDYSGPGERADYSRDPELDLRAGRAVEKPVIPDGDAGDDDDDAPSDLDDPGMADLAGPTVKSRSGE